MQPLISVIMSVYNESEEYISEAVESILNQSLSDFEFIIVNDNPKNIEIHEILKRIADLDERVVIINNSENIGLALSLNKGISVAKGKYIARMDADDVSLPQRLAVEIEKMDCGYDMVFSSRHNIDENGVFINDYIVPTIDEEKIKKILPWDCIVTHPSVMYRRDVFERLNGYRKFDVSQDYDLWLRMITADCKIGVIAEPLINYRIRRNAISSQKALLQFETARYIRSLYRERVNSQEDSYTYKNYEAYINSKGALNKDNNEKFQRASNAFYKSLQGIKNKQYLYGALELCKSLVGVNWVFYMIYRIKKMNEIR